MVNIPMVSSSILFLKKCVVIQGKSSDGLETKDSGAEELYFILSALFSYFLPLVLIMIIYLFTGYMSKRFFEDSYSRRERRMSKMISSLIVTFALCRLPSETITLLWFYQLQHAEDSVMHEQDMHMLTQDMQKFRVWIHVREYLMILSMLDMALRPIIYATMSREFGMVFDRIINCTYCKEEEEELPTRRHTEDVQEVLRTPLHQVENNIDSLEDEPEEIF